MSRPGSASAVSAQALAAAAAPPAAARIAAADELGSSASKNALARLNAAMSEVKALSCIPMLQRAMEAIRAEEPQGATEWALKALEKDEQNGFGWYLLAIAREKAGDFASSVQAYESALRLLPNHAEVANDLGRLAFRMGMHVQAEKLFRHFLTAYPGHPEGCNNLACALREQQRYEDAVAVLKPAIMAAPDNAVLWNTMGTVVGGQGDFATARLFFLEALQLQPVFPKARYNLSNIDILLGDPQAAIAACDEALAGLISEDERQMMRLARSTILLNLQRLGEGWDEYEARFHPQFAEVTHFLINRPRWEPGADLAGKTLLVIGEQGLGDEILFANTLPDVLNALGPEGRLILAVEHRLVGLFQRAFPQIEVRKHWTYAVGVRPGRGVPDLDQDQVDLWTPIASLLREFRREHDDYPPQSRVLAPIAERVAYWREQLAALPGRKVGLLWKSAINKDARHRYFAGFEAWESVLRTPGVTFVNLQYGDCAKELDLAKARFGVEIWQPPGVDLKQDLDEVAAICCALDLTVGFSNATFNIAAGCGAPAWLITTQGAWPRLGLVDRYLWYPQVRPFLLEAFGDWTPVMGQVAEALDGFAQEAQAA